MESQKIHIEPYLSEDQINFLKRFTDGKWTIDPITGLVNVDGNFYCASSQIKSFLNIKFGIVIGDLYCSHNQLTSLDGFPNEVGRDFYCDSNHLTSLVGGPKKVGREFSCSNNQITSLIGGPEEVGSDFFCSSNLLTSLEGAPKNTNGHLNLNGNRLSIISLGIIWSYIKLYPLYPYTLVLVLAYPKLTKNEQEIVMGDLKPLQGVVLEALHKKTLLDYLDVLKSFPSIVLTPEELQIATKLTKAHKLLKRKQ